MKKKSIEFNTSINRPKATVGETIEQKIQRITENGEPVKDGAPLIYTDYKDGIIPEYNVRTDKMDIAVEAIDNTAKNDLARRKEILDDYKKAQGGNSETEADSATSN